MKRILIVLVCQALLLGGFGVLAESPGQGEHLFNAYIPYGATAQPSEPGEKTAGEGDTGFLQTDFLKRGDKGDDVTRLQVKLIEHNYLADGADGDYGGKTEKAVKQVQADAGLPQTGVADDDTLAYLEDHYAVYVATKDSDALLYALEFEPATGWLMIHVKNTGRQRITGYSFKLYQCNASKTSMGSFYGTRNSSTKRKRTENWTEHSVGVEIESGENDYAVMPLSEGYTVTFNDGSERVVTYFDNAVYARVELSSFTTADGKSHKVNQRLYVQFR